MRTSWRGQLRCLRLLLGLQATGRSPLLEWSEVMNRRIAFALAALLAGSVTVASAQQTRDNMRGEMPEHPHEKIGPGSKTPMQPQRIEPRMMGEMPNHPHEKITRGSDRPHASPSIPPYAIGEWLGYPSARNP